VRYKVFDPVVGYTLCDARECMGKRISKVLQLKADIKVFRVIRQKSAATNRSGGLGLVAGNFCHPLY
jgi:hypothetical protein